MRKLAIFAGAFTAATAVYVYLLGDARAFVLAGACLLLSLLCRILRGNRCAIAFLGAAFALLWCFGYQSVFLGKSAAISCGEQVVTVRVTDIPQATKYGTSVGVDLNGYGAVLYGQEGIPDLKPGDIVTCAAKVERSALKPGNGESLYTRSQGISFILTARSKLSVTQGEMTWPEQVRHWLQGKINAVYKDEAAAFLRALLTGDRSGLDYAVQNRLSVAGISHTVAVSGMHVSMLLAMLSFLCGRNPRLTALLGIPVVVGFALMTGASASVCRAAIMHIIMLCAPLLGREHDGPTSLSAAALILLLADPWAIADVSFQLSFAAVLGLTLFSSTIQKRIRSWGSADNKMLAFLASGVGATLGATALTLPLTVFYFGAVSIVAIPVNLLCLWAVTAVFTVALISCVTGPFGIVLAWPVTWLVQYILGVCEAVSRWPFAAAYPENPAMMIWAAGMYLVVLLLFLRKWEKVRPWLISGTAVAFLLCAFLGNWNLCRGNMTLTAVGVGEGQCLILQSGGFTAVIDCGGRNPDAAGEAAVRVLHSAGITKVDAVILTHYDADHADGLEQFMDRVKVQRIFAPAHACKERTELEAVAETDRILLHLVEAEAGITFENGWMQLMAAQPGLIGNEGSLCVLAKAAEYDILVTGDRSERGELDLLARWPVPELDLLVAGHHGSKTSTSQRLLDHTKPKTVIISTEKNNSYGHPAPEVLQRIADTGAEILRTDLMGTITVSN